MLTKWKTTAYHVTLHGLKCRVCWVDPVWKWWVNSPVNGGILEFGSHPQKGPAKAACTRAARRHRG